MQREIERDREREDRETERDRQTDRQTEIEQGVRLQKERGGRGRGMGVKSGRPAVRV